MLTNKMCKSLVGIGNEKWIQINKFLFIYISVLNKSAFKTLQK